ncbi:MAG: hypothetical protein CM15mP74_10990 [Halieaceae bacterium]|nr:MAG: hypothetical protein CM15mP74_10990 [Halieaceae bacterium]
MLRINKELNRAADVDKQPPTLLDQRDAVLRDMSKLAKLGDRVAEWSGNRQFWRPRPGLSCHAYRVERCRGYASRRLLSDLRLVLDPYGVKGPCPRLKWRNWWRRGVKHRDLGPRAAGLDHLARTSPEANQIHRRALTRKGVWGDFSDYGVVQATTDTASGAITARLR